MSELRKAAQQALEALEGFVYHGIGPNSGPALASLRAALAQPEPLTQEIERLRAALRYEENRFSRVGTHGPDCWKWGPGHYECALRQIGSQP